MSPATIKNAARLIHRAQWTLRDLQSKRIEMALQSTYAREMFREENERHVDRRLRDLERELMQLEAEIAEVMP